MHVVREMEKHQRSEHLCDGNKNSDNAQNKTFSLKSLMFFPRRSEVTRTDRRRRRQNRTIFNAGGVKSSPVSLRAK